MINAERCDIAYINIFIIININVHIIMLNKKKKNEEEYYSPLYVKTESRQLIHRFSSRRYVRILCRLQIDYLYIINYNNMFYVGSAVWGRYYYVIVR